MQSEFEYQKEEAQDNILSFEEFVIEEIDVDQVDSIAGFCCSCHDPTPG